MNGHAINGHALLQRRTAGVLLHITSLPGPDGCGDFGATARHFVDWLVSAGQSVWQLLPLHPVGPGHSPYQSVSAFAGCALMVALEPLVERGWLAAATPPPFSAHTIEWERVVAWRMQRLREAAAGFAARAGAAERDAHAQWCAREAGWLDDYALFKAIDAAYRRGGGEGGWWRWQRPLAAREPAALAAAARTLADDIAFWRFVQWSFDTQWAALHAYARQRGVAVMGDLPIFVAHHSADCWARPDLYQFDAAFEPSVVAGVPPDYFSPTGQRWGNPLYRWERMAAEGHAWWTARVRRALALVDLFRIDHFRGFVSCWEIPAASPTAVDGRWAPGPGAALFDALEAALGRLPIVAEDLGLITPDVVALRERCGYPGMKVLQFAFGGDAGNTFLPHHHPPDAVVYSGTHDNDTSLGWWRGASAHERAFAAAYLGLDAGADDATVPWALVRAALTSPARLAIVPMQDVLGLDGTHRMNRPGTTEGNWGWRFDWGMVGAAPGRRLAALAAASGRAPIERLGA